MIRYLLPLGLFLTLAGYFGPWVNHAAAGLVITGLDLGEYVKFLPAVYNDEIWLWRPGFYFPLIAAGAAAACAAFRREFAYPWLIRVPLLIVAAVATANLLPPAWTPTRMLQAEFRVQTSAIVLLAAAIGFSPFLALLPRAVAGALVAGLSVAALFFALVGFFQILPAVAVLYGRPLSPAWGPWLMAAGLALIPLSYLPPVWPAGRMTKGEPNANWRDE